MQFFTSFCAGCILLGALGILCPDGNVSKSVKHIFSLIFLIIIISAANFPLKQIEFPTYSTETQSTDEMQIASAEYVFSHTLKSAGINFSKIDIFTDKTQDQSIVITKVVVTTDQPLEKVKNALGILAENREVEVTDE